MTGGYTCRDHFARFRNSKCCDDAKLLRQIHHLDILILGRAYIDFECDLDEVLPTKT